MRRSDHPGRPKAKTCCFFSSFKTLAMPTEPTSLRAGINVPDATLVGRFSGDTHRPVLGFFRTSQVTGSATFTGSGTTVQVTHASFAVDVETLKSDRDRKSTRLNSSHLGISYAV